MLKFLLKGVAATTLAVATLGTPTYAQELTPIKISYQPAVYWALPFYVAEQKGWWQQVGLKPEFSIFPAGVPQMAASASKSWDVGAAGSVPAILGHVRFKVDTIGITNDESAGNALVVAADKVAEYEANPQLIKGKTIGVQTSTNALAFLENFFKGDIQIREYKTSEQHDLDLSAGRIDAVFVDYASAMASLGKKELQGMTVAGPAFRGGLLGRGVAIGLRKDDGGLKQSFDQAIDQARADGTVKTLSLKWFKSDMSPPKS